MSKENVPKVELEPPVQWLVEAAIISAKVSNYCDKTEHAEQASPIWISGAGLSLRGLALKVADHAERDIFDLYENRLDQIEERNVLHGVVALMSKGDNPIKLKRVPDAKTWRDLQLVQIDHDRYYHPDVIGMKPWDQVRHHAFHLSKITGKIAEQVTVGHITDEFINTRLADMLLFGIVLATVSNQTLEETPLPRKSTS